MISSNFRLVLFYVVLQAGISSVLSTCFSVQSDALFVVETNANILCVAPDAFAGMPSLEHVDLGFNAELTTLPSGLFLPCPLVDYLSIEGTSLGDNVSGFCGIANLGLSSDTAIQMTNSLQFYEVLCEIPDGNDDPAAAAGNLHPAATAVVVILLLGMMFLYTYCCSSIGTSSTGVKVGVAGAAVGVLGGFAD